MSSSNSSFTYLTALDLYYLSTSSKIFLYGYIIIMIIGFIGNICQIITFSRKTMRNISTGILFLALSISDTIYLLLCLYTLIVYGFNVPDRSNYGQTCQFKHFISYLSTNFSAWMLTTISCDRWIRSKFPLKSQRLCTPRTVMYCIIVALIFDCLLHVHLLTPMFGQIAPGVTTTCGANRLYPTYSFFYVQLWPTITILSVTVIPAVCMVFFVVAIAINVRNSRNRVIAIRSEQSNTNPHEQRRARFLHRQMLILMFATLILFFVTTFPVAVFRFAMSTLGVQQAFSLSLLLAAVFGLIIVANYSLNFYLHCLTSKLFRKEFLKCLPCSISISFRHANEAANVTATQRYLNRQQQGTVTQLMGQVSNTYGHEKNCVTTL